MECILLEENDLTDFLEIAIEYVAVIDYECFPTSKTYTKALEILKKFLTEDLAIKYFSQSSITFNMLPDIYKNKEFISKCKISLYNLLGTPFYDDKVIISKIIDNGAMDLYNINSKLFEDDPEYLQEILNIGLSDPKYNFGAIATNKKYLLEIFKKNPINYIPIMGIFCDYRILNDIDFIKSMIKTFPEYENVILYSAESNVVYCLKKEKKEIEDEHRYKKLFDSF